MVRRAISLTVNTIVIIVLAVAVFAIALIMLFTAQKGGNTILSVGRFYVSDADQLFEAKKQCKTLCQWAKTSGDFLNSKYCNYQVSLKLVDSQTGETVEKLFYCWQKPISVYCEDLQEIAGQYINYYYVDPEEGCKEFTLSSYDIVSLTQKFANAILYSKLNQLLSKPVTDIKTFIGYLLAQGVISVENDQKQVKAVFKNSDGKEIEFSIQNIALSTLPPNLVITTKNYIQLSCMFQPNELILSGMLYKVENGEKIPWDIPEIADNGKLDAVILGNVRLDFVYDNNHYTAYYPLVLNFVTTNEDLIKAAHNKEVLDLITKRIGTLICTYITS